MSKNLRIKNSSPCWIAQRKRQLASHVRVVIIDGVPADIGVFVRYIMRIGHTATVAFLMSQPVAQIVLCEETRISLPLLSFCLRIMRFTAEKIVPHPCLYGIRFRAIL